jgi:hypothetical protein
VTPEEKCADAVQSAVDQLRALVSVHSTQAVAGKCFAYHLKRLQPGGSPDSTLVSPARQTSFLLGLLLATAEPAEPREFTDADWNRAAELLQEAFLAYQILFLPDAPLPDPPPTEWLRVRDLALPQFLHTFNTGLLASGEQIANRIRTYLAPFDEQLRTDWGLTATEALEIAEWVDSKLNQTLDHATEGLKKAKAVRKSFLTRAQANKWSLKEIREAAQDPSVKAPHEQALADLRSVGLIRLDELDAAFPSLGSRFVQVFAISRGAGPDLRFPTDRSVFQDRPLVLISPNEATVPLLGAVYSAVLECGERILESGASDDRYRRARDRQLERETESYLRKLLGGEFSIYPRVSEEPTGEFEHDAVATGPSLGLVVEAKATKPDAPFRDPEKAYARLRRAFRAETGIQHAYDQALHLWRRLKSGEDVSLFDAHREEVARIPCSAANYIFLVCVTRDNHGPLATDLSLLLEKQPHEPYPWVVNILDLEALAEAWSFFGWDSRKFAEFLRVRLQLHGRVFSWDELEYAGYFIRHGSLEPSLRGPTELVFLNPLYSDVFDEIHNHLHHGAPAPDLTTNAPVTHDVRRSLELGRPVVVGSQVPDCSTRPSRNDPCPCGSGRKFKNCCGRPD